MKKIKKSGIFLGALGSILAPLGSTIACSQGGLDPSKKDSIVMIVGASGHDDKGFLQGAYEGAQEAINAKFGLNKYSETKINTSSIDDAKIGSKSALTAGSYTILGVGYQYPTFFNSKDYAGKYKDRMFVGIDGSTNDKNFQPLIDLNENVINVAFKAEQASFLSGVATGLYLTKNYDAFKDDGLKVGAFGGIPYSTVTDMISGFMQGIAYYNDNLAIDNDHKVKFIGWQKAENGFSGGFTPSDKSTSVAKQLLSKNADIIFPVAGGQVSSVVDAIKGKKDSRTKIIGVDSDQTNVFGNDGKYFITSAMKDTKTSTLEALKAVYGKETKLKMGKNNFVGLEGGFVKLAKGIIDDDEYKGNKFTGLLKANKDIISTQSGDTIYTQLSSSNNSSYKYAKTSVSGSSWNEVKDKIFGAKSDSIVKLSDFV